MDGNGQRDDGCKLDPQQQQQQQEASDLQAERGVKRGRESVAGPSCGQGVEPVPKVARPETSTDRAGPAASSAQVNGQQGNAVRPARRVGRRFVARVQQGAGRSLQGRAPRQQRVAPSYRIPCPPLPMFDGNPLNWANFHLAWLDSNAQGKFTDDEKRARLRQALRGVAMLAVHDMLHTGQSPDAIYRVLYQRFHHTAHHFSILLHKVYESVRPAQPHLLSMLCNFRDALVELIRNLHLHRVHLLMNNCELANYLAAMLPAEYFRTWSLYFNNGDNLYGLLAFTQLKLCHLQRAAILLDSPSDTEPESDN